MELSCGPLGGAIDQGLQRFTQAKLDEASSGTGTEVARPGISELPCIPIFGVEGSESRKNDFVAQMKLLNDDADLSMDREQCLQGPFNRVRASFFHRANEIALVHSVTS